MEKMVDLEAEGQHFILPTLMVVVVVDTPEAEDQIVIPDLAAGAVLLTLEATKKIFTGLAEGMD